MKRTYSILFLLLSVLPLKAQEPAAEMPMEMREALEEAKAKIDREQDLKSVFEEFKGAADKSGHASRYYVGERAYTFKVEGAEKRRFSILKCSIYDFRVFRLCPVPDFFEANARVYFDKGSDREGKVDLFKNGSFEPALQLVSIRLPWRFGRADAFDLWSWGPEISAGLGPGASDEEDGEQKSTAPVVLASLGLRLTYKVSDDGTNFSFEVGRALGFTTDEAFFDKSDAATYVGIKIKYVPKSGK